MSHRVAAEHLTLDELADLAVGELPGDAAAAATAHVAGCAGCRSELERLSVDLDLVSSELAALGNAPSPPMPVTVTARLDRVLAEESERRLTGAAKTAGPVTGSAAADPGAGGPWADAATERAPGDAAATVTPLRRPTPLKAPASASYVQQTGAVRIMLAAAVAAAVVGFGGYIVSASAGLNEPSVLSPTQVHPNALTSQAETLAKSRDLDPHLFSAAWRCARQVTSGRITGITPVYVDGQQNYLVYTRSGGITYATLVSGCEQDTPAAERRVKLTE